MKNLSKLVAVALVSAALFFANEAKAQMAPAARQPASDITPWNFSIGLETGAPIGKEGPKSNFELGGTARLQYNVNNSFALTATSGLYNFFGKAMPNASVNYSNFDIIPLKGGIKAFFAHNVYFGAEAGAGFVQNNGNTKFIWSPALGYDDRRWDIGLRYENFSGGKIDATYGLVGLRIGYNL